MTTQITYTAPILLPGDPSTALQASTKQYADTKVPQTRNINSGTGLTGGGALSADLTLAVSYGTTSTTSCVGNDSRLSDSRTPSGTAGGSLNGTYPNPALDLVPWSVVALTDATTISVTASSGNHFRVTLGGNRTMGAPSSPTDGQKILFEIIQDATGSRTLAWTSGAGGYAFGSDVTSPTLTTTASKRDFVGFVYNSTANLWYCLAVARGY